MTSDMSFIIYYCFVLHNVNVNLQSYFCQLNHFDIKYFIEIPPETDYKIWSSGFTIQDLVTKDLGCKHLERVFQSFYMTILFSLPSSVCNYDPLRSVMGSLSAGENLQSEGYSEDCAKGSLAFVC